MAQLRVQGLLYWPEALINDNYINLYKKLNLANTENMSRIGWLFLCWPSFSVLGEFFHIGRVYHQYYEDWFGLTDTVLM